MSTADTTGRVVVEVDGSADGLRVLDYAAQEALKMRANLCLTRPFRGFTSYSPMTPVYYPQDAAADAARALHDATARVRRQVGYALSVEAVAREGSRLDVLAQLGRTARLLVVARRRVRGPHRLVAAQMDLALAARSSCPVVVVPRSWKPSGLDRTVAVGVDGSMLSWEAVEHAFATASSRDADLLVVHAAEAPRRTPQADAEAAWINSVELTVAETLAGWQENYPDVRVTRVLSKDPVLETLLREAEHAGLLVLGVHADTNRLIGDPVTRRTVAAATCPVAMVRHQVTDAERERARAHLRHAGGGDVFAPAR